MQDDSPLIVSTRLYTLEEARELLGVTPYDLVHLAAAHQIYLCALVPGTCRAYVVDPGSVFSWDARAQAEAFVFRSKPSPFPVPVRREDVLAVVINSMQCQLVLDYGVAREVFFLSAYSAAGTGGLGSSGALVHARAYGFEKSGGVITTTVSTRARFVVYPVAADLSFIKDAGYPEPQSLVLTVADIRVLGSELERLPTASHTPELAGGKAQDTAPKSPSHEEPKPKPVVGDVPLASTGPDAALAGADSTPAREMDGDSTRVIPDDRAPAVLLGLEEVRRRIDKGKSWIYERTQKKHRNYDPTFPQSIRIGGTVSWIEAEIELWLQREVEKNRGPAA